MELSVTGLRAAKAVASVVPDRIARPMARNLGLAASQLSIEQRTAVRENLRRVYGADLDESRLRAAAREVFANYALYWLDSLRVTDLSLDELDQRVTVDGFEHLATPLESGQGVIAAIPHLGSWEAGARWLAQIQNIHVVAAVERLEPPELYEWFVEYRTKELGIEVVPVDNNASQKLAAALGAGAMLTLLCDRDLSGDGVEVDFFGEPTTLPPGPALLALRSGCPLVPLAVYQRGNKFHGIVREPIHVERQGRLREDIRRVTQNLAYVLEELIREAPTQWHVLQPNWPSDAERLT